MNNNDKELLKNTPSIIKGIAVQAEHLNGKNNLSFSLKDACGVVEFGLALGCQLGKADKTNTGKVIAECAVGGILFGILIGLSVANIANNN